MSIVHYCELCEEDVASDKDCQCSECPRFSLGDNEPVEIDLNTDDSSDRWYDEMDAPNGDGE